MNRRVRRTIRPREPRQVKRGTEGPAEDGLGVAWPTAAAQAMTCAHVTAQERVGAPKGRLCEETRETRWYHGAETRSSLRLALQGLSFCLPGEEGVSELSEPIIQIQHLSKLFGGGEDAVRALEDINLDIQQGEIFGIIGLSGAGKSTLVRCMNLLERPTEGRVLVDGQSLTDLSDKELREARRKITMIFQGFNLLMQRTCLKNVCFPMEISKVPAEQARKRAMELLELVGLGDKAQAYPAQLSGGQKQRVAIARALATNPKVLLCDEATSALDPTTTISILNLLKDLNQSLGVTVVVITHQMSVIEEICSRVAILDGGSVAEMGDVQEIFSNPTTDAARRLVYPGGVTPAQFPTGGHVIRISFNGGTAYDPLIASLAIDCGVKVNILGADTRNVGGKAIGTMLLGLPENRNDAAKALNYIRAQKNITVEEVPDYHE